jgi:hypothetical protein
MAFLALVDAPLSSESMKFPVFSSKRHQKSATDQAVLLAYLIGRGYR